MAVHFLLVFVFSFWWNMYLSGWTKSSLWSSAVGMLWNPSNNLSTLVELESLYQKLLQTKLKFHVLSHIGRMTRMKITLGDCDIPASWHALSAFLAIASMNPRVMVEQSGMETSNRKIGARQVLTAVLFTATCLCL